MTNHTYFAVAIMDPSTYSAAKDIFTALFNQDNKKVLTVSHSFDRVTRVATFFTVYSEKIEASSINIFERVLLRYKLDRYYTFDNTDANLDNSDAAHHFIQVAQVDEKSADYLMGKVLGCFAGSDTAAILFNSIVFELTKDIMVIVYASYVLNVAKISGKVSAHTTQQGRVLSTFLG